MALIRFDIEFRSGGEQSPFFGRAQQKPLPENFLGLESHIVRTVDLIELGAEKPEEAGISSFSSSSSSKSQKSDPKPALSMDGLAQAIGCMIKPDVKAFYGKDWATSAMAISWTVPSEPG
ncbi:hypothetical protein A4X06_0g2449 [Tilletia controversa]|uniref:Uncharacterized protein n=1 Tax=Tilletia controversa TaxID=13291 RepID=A0A8X7MWI9_9BASI|nr:hypothetical protein CF328_g2006 [Tilletia controversa]KAE8252027.1 hypothetical protein A4X06_0g2449 [Tilletia controversa]